MCYHVLLVLIACINVLLWFVDCVIYLFATLDTCEQVVKSESGNSQKGDLSNEHEEQDQCHYG